MKSGMLWGGSVVVSVCLKFVDVLVAVVVMVVVVVVVVVVFVAVLVVWRPGPWPLFPVVDVGTSSSSNRSRLGRGRDGDVAGAAAGSWRGSLTSGYGRNQSRQVRQAIGTRRHRPGVGARRLRGRGARAAMPPTSPRSAS
ncbi:hypothetical protein E2C01_063303 [Portunus trituberculatus]|uniref:Uncharacterized protein n=1 Tax=Portunus trituberculatus TaxID=210409 RepID=A0A5B7HJX8_PORTR|nr:hypothetical protein [Portunus trituberculatus]